MVGATLDYVYDGEKLLQDIISELSGRIGSLGVLNGMGENIFCLMGRELMVGVLAL